MRKILFFLSTFVMLSGCYMVPMAFIGPATSNFTTASIIQSTMSSSAGYLIKKSTGKSVTEHVLEAMNEETAYQQTYLPTQRNKYFPQIIQILPKSKPKS